MGTSSIPQLLILMALLLIIVGPNRLIALVVGIHRSLRALRHTRSDDSDHRAHPPHR